MSFVSNIPFLRSGTFSRIGAALRGDAADADGDGAAAASTTEEEAEAGMGRTREGLLTDLKTVASQRPPARIQAPRYLFIASLMALLAIGLVMIYSASSIEGLYYFNNPAYYLERQLFFLTFGGALCVFLVWFPYEHWSGRLGEVVLALIILALIATALYGSVRGGSRRWITIGPADFQPSEFAKIACIMVVASLQAQFVERAISRRRYGMGILFSAIIPLGLILMQPDMGTATIALIGILAVFWLGGWPKQVFVWLVAAVIIGMVLLIAVEPYRMQRFAAGFNASSDPLDEGYQLMNSLYAFGSGGFLGMGLGNGRQKFFYLPESKNDFIFAVIGEELGLLGCLVVIALFLLLIVSGIRIAHNADSLYGKLVAGACTVVLGAQAFVNIFQTLGLFPVTGKPLPFISYGGSSLIASLMLAGLVLSVSFHSNPVNVPARRREGFHILGGGRDEADTSLARAAERSRREQRPAEEVHVISRAEARLRKQELGQEDAPGDATAASDRGKVLKMSDRLRTRSQFAGRDAGRREGGSQADAAGPQSRSSDRRSRDRGEGRPGNPSGRR